MQIPFQLPYKNVTWPKFQLFFKPSKKRKPKPGVKPKTSYMIKQKIKQEIPIMLWEAPSMKYKLMFFSYSIKATKLQLFSIWRAVQRKLDAYNSSKSWRNDPVLALSLVHFSVQTSEFDSDWSVCVSGRGTN